MRYISMSFLSAIYGGVTTLELLCQLTCATAEFLLKQLQKTLVIHCNSRSSSRLLVEVKVLVFNFRVVVEEPIAPQIFLAASLVLEFLLNS